jgi:hypothetical protein
MRRGLGAVGFERKTAQLRRYSAYCAPQMLRVTVELFATRLAASAAPLRS